MNRLEYTLTHLIEEASEIQKAATKALRFGLSHVDEKNGRTNRENIAEEINDLLGVRERLEFQGVELPAFSPEEKARKLDKGERMYQLARKLGTID